MFGSKLSLCTILLLAVGGRLPAYAQRGVGDQVGVAQQGLHTSIVKIEGKLVSIETGPCEKTTGLAGVGTHLMLEDANGKAINLHLGDAGAVARYVRDLEIGDKVVADAFRTDKMAADHYVAVKVTVGDESFALRDESLRPSWAGQRRGGNCPWGGPGYGRGYGGGYGYGAGYGPCRWNSDAPQPGSGAGGAGRGYRGGRP